MKHIWKLLFFLVFALCASAQDTKMSALPQQTNPGDGDNVIGYAYPGGTGTTRRFDILDLWQNYYKGKAENLFQPKSNLLSTLASVQGGIPYISASGNVGLVSYSGATFNTLTGQLTITDNGGGGGGGGATKPYHFFFNGSSSTASTPGYPPKVAEYGDWDALGITWHKYGVPSAYVWSLNNAAPANVDIYVDSTKTNVLVIQMFNNDLADGTTPSTLINQLNSYITNRRSAGWDKILIIIPAYPKVYADHRYDANIVAFINLLMADPSYVNGTKADGFIRVDAEMLLRWSNNTTYYNAGDQHMNSTGYALFGATVAAEIRAWMNGARGTSTLAISSPPSGQSVAQDFTANISGFRHWQMLEWWASVPNAIGNGVDETMYRVAVAPNAPPNTVTIKAADMPQAATKLYVRGRDTLGKLYVSSPVTLSPVTAAPVITQQPVNITPSIGSPASFSVTATGASSYQWFKDLAVLSGATASVYSIPSVSSADDGTYYVIASNAAGSTQSANATLTSTTGATSPTITTQPQSQTVITGSPFSLTVAATGTPTLLYQWRKNGVNISGATATTYSVLSAVSGDAGSYTCVVSNVQGSATSNPATITVATASTIIEDTFASGDMLTSPKRVPDTTGSMTWSPLVSYTNQGGYFSLNQQYAKIDAGVANVTVSVEQQIRSGSTPSAGIVTRFTGTNDRIRFRCNPTTWQIEKIVAGSATTVASGSISYTTNTWHTHKVIASGDTFYMYVDGVLLNPGGTVISDVTASTQVGFSQVSSGAVWYRNFKVTTP